jgi:energy-coupling factor transporter ATP-binding protein EcfA2
MAPGTSVDGPAAGIPRASLWIQRFVAEIARGRHVILHGNVHDVTIWKSQFVPVSQAVRDVLETFGYGLVASYDQIDGLTFAGEDGSARFTRLLESGSADGAVPSGGSSTGQPPVTQARGSTDTATGGRADRAATARRQTAGAFESGTAEPVRYTRPRDALAAIRRGLAQTSTPIAVVVDFAELLLTDPEHNDRDDRDLLLLVKKTMMESGRVPGSSLGNQLLLVTADLANVPAWLYHEEPFVRPVEVPLPDHRERRAYLENEVPRYYGYQRGQDYEKPLRVLTNLTEGMALSELSGLRHTSKLVRVPLQDARELVNRAVFGQQEDPWQRLVGLIPQASRILGERVLGQEAAVAAVSRGLAAATLGIDFVSDPFSVEARPKGVFFFAGPTGVGKTELCRALSQLIFDDETALIRFDMSTFSEPHTAERLTGAPPGYVGHERGGELTNRVSERPFSVLLFDEIEKAHPAIFDKFLQILEDGRLTDGLGKTTYFSQTLIIFTSNLGAAGIYEKVRDEGLPSVAEVQTHFEEAVRRHFTTELNRPELLSRLGNGVLAFDLLRPQHIDAIASKFLSQLVASSTRAGITLDLERDSILDAVRREMSRPEAMALGGRQVRNVLDRIVRDPLVDTVRETGQRQGGYTLFVPGGESVARAVPSAVRPQPQARHTCGYSSRVRP